MQPPDGTMVLDPPSEAQLCHIIGPSSLSSASGQTNFKITNKFKIGRGTKAT